MRGTLDRLEASLDEVVPALLRRTGTPGLSLAAVCGDEALVRAWGLHDVAARRPMVPGSLFPLGSMTKVYTAIAVLQLVEDGVIGLHDPVDALLDDVACVNPLGARPVTVYDLLTFRSGLAVDTPASSLAAPPPLGDHVRDSLAAERVREYGGAAPRWTARAGERYQYANLGISTLGLVVERRNPERLPLGELVRRRILEPLGMERTWLSAWRDAEPHPDRATGYACFGGLAVPSPELRSADFPADGIHSTPAEHLRLLRALMAAGELDGARILRRETVRLMLTPQVSMDGSDGVWPSEGWQTGLVAILTDLGGRKRRFGHPGAHPWGWWGTAWAYPALDCAVVACANGWDMLGWHNPANREPTTVAADAVATFCATPPRARTRPRSWAWKRSYVAGALLAERTAGTLGVASPLPAEAPPPGATLGDGWDASGYLEGLRAGSDPPLSAARAAEALAGASADAPAPEQLEALLQELGMAYGCPTPLWLWDGPPVTGVLFDQ
jgi:CubicO group peptidase (beta-lactamase class C family)